MRTFMLLYSFIIFGTSSEQLRVVAGQNYEVADIDCALSNGRELLTARLRRPEGFRGVPVFADDTKQQSKSLNPFNLLPSVDKMDSTNHIHQEVSPDPPCQIFPDPTDTSGRVFILRVADFSQCGVLKRNGFIHVRVWFPQLSGVVMLSDQEVIIMCKPPEAVVTQSKAAGFAGSIPSGARVSGIVEESPGRLEYEVALFRETTNSGGRSVPEYITGINSQELAVDQAVPIGTRLQLRAKISSDSVWQHAKLMEVSVSPDPKNPAIDGSVVLVKDGCRNPELTTIIPKQPYRYKERSNEVVLDFEAFLLSNMGEKNTLWLHTEIKACMEVGDCGPEFCLDVYQPSGFGKKRKKRSLSGTTGFKNASESFDYVNPISQHWKTILAKHQKLVNNETQDQVADGTGNSPSKKVIHNKVNNNGRNTQFDENIGFSVLMPADYYRSMKVDNVYQHECHNWMISTLGCSIFSAILVVIVLILWCKLKSKGKKGYGESNSRSNMVIPIPAVKPVISQPILQDESKESPDAKAPLNSNKSSRHFQKHHYHHHHHSSTQYARDTSLYRP